MKHMHISVKAPGRLKNIEVQLPSSKSISNRLLVLNALSYSSYPVQNLSDSDDTKAMLSVFDSNGNVFDVGAAGTTMRFLTAYLSKIAGEWVITGSERMKQRPISVLVDALVKLGARIEYIETTGYPPLRIFGSALVGGDIELPGNISSQYISALLMVGPTMEKGLKLTLEGNITSKPYITLTLKLMEKYGVICKWNDNVIEVPAAGYIPTATKVESDWSAASYWFEMVALGQKGDSVCLKGLDNNSWQGDSKVAELFKPLGVEHEFTSNGLTIVNTGLKCSRFTHDFTKEPDLAQTFAVTCALLDVPFHFTGLHTLKIKETDRISALTVELAKLGFALKTNNTDDLSWDGKKDSPQRAIEIYTYKDHRMAMAFAPAALKIGEVKILDHMVVTKSYPGFWNDLREAGFTSTIYGG